MRQLASSHRAIAFSIALAMLFGAGCGGGSDKSAGSIKGGRGPNGSMTCGYLMNGVSSSDAQSQPGVNVMRMAGIPLPVHGDPAALVLNYCVKRRPQDLVDRILDDKTMLRAAYKAAYGEDMP